MHHGAPEILPQPQPFIGLFDHVVVTKAETMHYVVKGEEEDGAESCDGKQGLHEVDHGLKWNKT